MDELSTRQEFDEGSHFFADADGILVHGNKKHTAAVQQAGVRPPGVEHLRAALDLSRTPTCFLSMRQLRFVATNQAAEVFFSASKGELRSLTLFDFVPEREWAALKSALSLLETSQVKLATTFVSAGNGINLSRLVLQRVGDYIVVVDQSTETSAQRAMSDLDSLTGLKNRGVLKSRIQLLLDRQARDWGVLFIDLNNYKEVNDRCGHVMGDEVLVDFAAKLAASARPNDVVARFGGDEFVVIVDRITNIVELRTIAERISDDVTVTLTRQVDAPIVVTASVGCAIVTDDFSRVEQIIDAADRDMYRVKRQRPR